MFDRLRATLARLIAPPRRQASRAYSLGKPSRLTDGWGTSVSSEDAELLTSLRVARSRSRQLIRDAAYAKRAKAIIQNNVIGAGMGMQAKVKTSRDQLNTRINDDIELAWETWMCAESSHTGGVLHFHDMERMLVGQVFEAGEIFVRSYDERFGDSKVPFALDVIEPERVADDFFPGFVPDGARVRLGVEVDRFHRPQAYYFLTLHPGEIRLTAQETSKMERVPAASIKHLRLVERWPQTRAIPWMHAAARKLNDMDGLTEAEITAARGAACYMGFIESPDGETSFGEPQTDGSVQEEIEPAMVKKLKAGEKFNFAAPNRPNSQLDPFMRMMLREVAAGTGCSYESLSRDYSQSNYSSSRLALLDDRDLWRMLQSWYMRSYRVPIHKAWLRQAVLSRAIPSISIEAYAADPAKFEAVCFKPRGWNWIDPTKEVEAYKEAVRCGFTTVTSVIAQTGNGTDLEDVLTERRQELDAMAEKQLEFETDPTKELPPKAEPPAQEPAPEPDEDAAAMAEKMLRGL